MKDQDTLLTIAALFAAVLFWGLSFVATKVALLSFDPLTLIFLRFFVAALFFLLLFSRYGFPPLTAANLQGLALLAFLQPGCYFTCETFGLQYTSATKTSLIIATIPVVVLLLASIFLEEGMGRRGLLGIILSLIGVALLVTSGGELGGSVFGDLLIFGAVVSAALYMLFTRRLGASLSSLQITGMQVIFGAIIFFPAFLYELPDLRWREVGVDALLAVAALAIFATIGAFLCYNYALTKIPASSAAVCINGIPLVTAGASWLLLGEVLSPLQLVGGAVVLLGVFLAHQRPTASKGST